MRKILSLLLCCFLFACSDKVENKDLYDWILTADPEKDAISAARSGDKTLIGISSMSGNELPTAGGYKCQTPKNIRFLKLDDLIETYAEQKYNALAGIYADSYNYHLFKYFRAQGHNICNS